MSQGNQFAFVPCSIVFASPHLGKCFDRCNKAPLACSQVNNGSWLMFLFLLRVPALWLSLPYPTFLFAAPTFTVQESLCLCKVTFLASPRQSTPASTPPPQTAPPLPSHLTHSLPSFLCGDWYCDMLELIPFIFHTYYSAVNTFTGTICSLWKQIILLSYTWCHKWRYMIFWS